MNQLLKLLMSYPPNEILHFINYRWEKFIDYSYSNEKQIIDDKIMLAYYFEDDLVCQYKHELLIELPRDDVVKW
jgi:hypothetical protein